MRKCGRFSWAHCASIIISSNRDTTASDLVKTTRRITIKYCHLAFLVAFLQLVGCATNKPIIYPNTHSQAVGTAQADIDIAECRRLANAAGASSIDGKVADTAKRTVRGGGVGAATGAVGGAIAGRAGHGAAIGAASGATASLIYSLFGESSGNSTYRTFITRCLTDRGYDLAGWD